MYRFTNILKIVFSNRLLQKENNLEQNILRNFHNSFTHAVETSHFNKLHRTCCDNISGSIVDWFNTWFFGSKLIGDRIICTNFYRILQSLKDMNLSFLS